MNQPAKSFFQDAAEQLHARGISLTLAPGEYIVNFRKGTAATEYRTDDLADALAHGLDMGEAPAELPPIGPTGKGRMSKRAQMYQHNRKLAARRRKAERP